MEQQQDPAAERPPLELVICESGHRLLAKVARALPGTQVVAHGPDVRSLLDATSARATSTVLLVDIHSVPEDQLAAVISHAPSRAIVWIVPLALVADGRHPAKGLRNALADDFSDAELIDVLTQVVSAFGAATPDPDGDVDFIAHADVMRALLFEADLFADCSHSVLILGETGTGKERIAQRLHRGHSRYGRGPFVPVNCGAIPDGLFESHFFGHARGAFTGALHMHKGYFEQAHGGTLFLDEVGDLPPLQQVKLLRVLETNVITRLGTEAAIPVDFRLVAATNQDLHERVARGLFRSDLYYRLAVIELNLPTLEERGSIDKLAIFRTVVEQVLGPALAARLGTPPAWLTECVAATRFPGNVRQLRSLSERIAVIARQTGQWDRALCERALASVRGLTASSTLPAQPDPTPKATRKSADAARERQLVIDALQAHGWRRQDTARQLGISRKSLWERMRKYEIGFAGPADLEPPPVD